MGISQSVVHKESPEMFSLGFWPKFPYYGGGRGEGRGRRGRKALCVSSCWCSSGAGVL